MLYTQLKKKKKVIARSYLDDFPLMLLWIVIASVDHLMAVIKSHVEKDSEVGNSLENNELQESLFMYYFVCY